MISNRQGLLQFINFLSLRFDAQFKPRGFSKTFKFWPVKKPSGFWQHAKDEQGKRIVTGS
jgi:hypothetical protein